MKKLLFVGDSPDCPSGFGRATREILDRVRDGYEVTVLGINHRGDPSTTPYPVYTAAAGGDAYGIGRLLWMCDLVKPDVIAIQQDGWYFPYYFRELRKKKANHEYEDPEIAAIPVVGAVAVDGRNFNGEWIKDLTLAIFWTQFALDEARIGGYAGPALVIPLGVDTEMFYPVSRDGAMERQRIGTLKDKFLVGNVNRNQPRKRWDLTLKYFAKWVHEYRVPEARLFLHTAPTGDQSVNVHEVACYYGIQNQVVIYTPEPFYGKADDDMRDVYNCFDVLISTSQGEGMGLPALEAMACGRACILPENSAYKEWARSAAALIPCTSTAMQSFMPIASVIGEIADERAFITALDKLYREPEHRELIAHLGFVRVTETRFRWQTIGEQWIAALDAVLTPPTEETPTEIWQDLKKVEVAQ